MPDGLGWHTLPIEPGDEVSVSEGFDQAADCDLLEARFGHSVYYLRQDVMGDGLRLRLAEADGETRLQVFGLRKGLPPLEQAHEDRETD